MPERPRARDSGGCVQREETLISHWISSGAALSFTGGPLAFKMADLNGLGVRGCASCIGKLSLGPRISASVTPSVDCGAPRYVGARLVVEDSRHDFMRRSVWQGGFAMSLLHNGRSICSGGDIGIGLGTINVHRISRATTAAEMTKVINPPSSSTFLSLR